MNFSDMHIHLQDYKTNCATDIISAAVKIGVNRFVCAATSEKDWQAVKDFALNKRIIPAFGIHPWYVGDVEQGWEQRLKNILEQNPQALVGECGLDGLKPDFELQKEVFDVHRRLAKELKRPLIVHAVKAVEALNCVLPDMPPRFMIHSFNGRSEHLRPIVQNGGYVSFSASILKNREGQKIILNIPADRLLLETDGPYQGPIKGEEQTPKFLPELLAQIAKWKNQEEDELSAQIEVNAKEFIYGKQ